jgi:hypothetical protein
MATKKKPRKSSSISFTHDDVKHINWLMKRYEGIGGLRQGQVISMALKSLYEQQRAILSRPQTVNTLPYVEYDPTKETMQDAVNRALVSGGKEVA